MSKTEVQPGLMMRDLASMHEIKDSNLIVTIYQKKKKNKSKAEVKFARKLFDSLLIICF